jgi:hypothetical protein
MFAKVATGGTDRAADRNVGLALPALARLKAVYLYFDQAAHAAHNALTLKSML